MTRQQIASMNVHPVDNPQNSLITLSDLREAARSCGFTTDPYSTPIISITHQHGNMGYRVFKWGVQNWKDFLPKNQHKVCFKKTVTHLLVYTVANVSPVF